MYAGCIGGYNEEVYNIATDINEMKRNNLNLENSLKLNDLLWQDR